MPNDGKRLGQGSNFAFHSISPIVKVFATSVLAHQIRLPDLGALGSVVHDPLPWVARFLYSAMISSNFGLLLDSDIL